MRAQLIEIGQLQGDVLVIVVDDRNLVPVVGDPKRALASGELEAGRLQALFRAHAGEAL